MVPDFDRADLWFHSGPTFDLFLWVPTDSPREAVKQAFLADGRVFRYPAAGQDFADLAGQKERYVLASPKEFPVPIWVGHSYVHRERQPLSSYVLFIRARHLERACGTDCLNSDDLGDPVRLVALHALLISLARSVRTRVPIASAIIRGESWPWPSVQDWGPLVAVHKNVARLADWESTEVDEDWVGVPLL
jgi:hypothetical protein